MPSKSILRQLLQGAQHFELEQAISYRLMMLAFILGLTLVVVLICPAIFPADSFSTRFPI